MSQSFIEVPQLGFGGTARPSLYVNVADIIALNSTYDNGTELNIRDLGAVGMSVTEPTYLPIGMFLDVLGELARFPGVRSWSDDTKDAYRIPAQERARAVVDREREAAARS
jgi:hypothetical protein